MTGKAESAESTPTSVTGKAGSRYDGANRKAGGRFSIWVTFGKAGADRAPTSEEQAAESIPFGPKTGKAGGSYEEYYRTESRSSEEKRIAYAGPMNTRAFGIIIR
jgi:hypothetical protein